MNEVNEKNENIKKQNSGNLSWYKYILIIIGIIFLIFIIKKIFFKNVEENKNGLQTRALPIEYDEAPDPLNPNRTKWILPVETNKIIRQNIKNQKNS